MGRSRSVVVASAIVALAGCSSLLGIHDPSVGGDGGTDPDTRRLEGNGAEGLPEGIPVTGSPVLLSEAVLAPTAGEMIEIVNTSNQAVDLTNYFVSDSGNYFRLPAGAPVVDATDFIAQFPAGASIPAHGVVTIAVPTAADFTTEYGIPPTFSIGDGTMTQVAGGVTPNLTSGGEVIVLFFWDGATDLVSDADILLAGSPSAGNSLIDKSGIIQDGPDADTTGSAYAIDAGSITIQNGTPGSGLSTKRIALEAGHETQAGTGNGLAGEDETSEDTSATWDSLVFSLPTPGAVPPALLQ